MQPSSLELGAHLKESGLLLHDAHEQSVNVVLEIFDLRLQPLQLCLSFGQQSFVLLKLGLLPLELHLPLHEKSHQFTVIQVVVRARSLGQRLLPVALLRRLAAPTRVDGGLELLQSGGQH